MSDSFKQPSKSMSRLSDRWTLLFWTLCLGFVFCEVHGTSEKTEPRDMRSGFQEYVELAPFEVVDEQLSISVYARSRGDRKYAVKFAEEVVDHAYGTLEATTGYGLVIVASNVP